MVYSSILGFPRLGDKRKLKRSLESYWHGRCSEEQLRATARDIRLQGWMLQAGKQIDFIASNDFSLYDHVLDTIAMVGAVPKRFGWHAERVDLNTYFAMARGSRANTENGQAFDAAAMEMTKWFNTNYHFIVPELNDLPELKLSSTKFVDEFLEAKSAGIHTRPVLLGPVTFLYLAKGHRLYEESKIQDQLICVYQHALSMLEEAGATWVQIDEPCLSLDLNGFASDVFRAAYKKLSQTKLSIVLTSYFGPLRGNLSWALQLPVSGIHLDLVSGIEDLSALLQTIQPGMLLSAGLIDGRNIWRCDYARVLAVLQRIADRIGPDRLIVSSSCSLMHVPLDAELERNSCPDILTRLAFARQKIDEIARLSQALKGDGLQSIQQAEEPARGAGVLNAIVREKLANLTDASYRRTSPYPVRKQIQAKRFNLPQLPTTTIGSFPQTDTIRDARKKWKEGTLPDAEYESLMEREIRNNCELQEKIGIDVLVHGEPERTDMVEHFAEMLEGIAITKHGWVQSYGSRYVRPPIIYGDVSRREPLTVRRATFAQAQSKKPVKGMLTGPVTMLQWSFVRDDQPREDTCRQLAVAIREEVADLQNAGIKIIQIDEPAIREGLPLRRDNRQEYLNWAIACFRLAASAADDDTQIHTHMCYSEFGDMVDSIIEMDADVISIEAARSQMDLLESLSRFGYPADIGPGVFDIHSPRVPSREEIEALIRHILKVIPADRLWINPDCGLKTRSWTEVVPALNAMVDAARNVRKSLLQSAGVAEQSANHVS